jgi:N-carbamoyl-L-amino-acid hydrolase
VRRHGLVRIDCHGEAALPLYRPNAHVELHVEQGPVLDAEGVTIGAVENLQGISWQEVSIVGESNHAGTTPMRLRHDAGHCAAAIGTFLRTLARDLGGNQVCTMGSMTLHPNLINVIAARASVTVDLRNTDETLLQEAELRLAAFLGQLARDEGVAIETQRLVRFEPVIFDAGVAALITRTAARLGHSCRTMTSGVGHDAQMLARICRAAMVFVPSVKASATTPRSTPRPSISPRAQTCSCTRYWSWPHDTHGDGRCRATRPDRAPIRARKWWRGSSRCCARPGGTVATWWYFPSSR